MIFIANWKMKKSFSAACLFARDHKKALNSLCSNETKIVLCPSYPALYSIAQELTNTHVAVGAQDCSAHEAGSYTGQVSALCIKQAGCTYCIVGHSEQRAHQTNKEIANKVMVLNTHAITPVICIGETNDEYTNKQTFETLDAQLEHIIPLLGAQEALIAYEPIWAIGTGTIPDNAYLADVFAWLAAKQISNCSFMYGGSVDEKNIEQLLQIEAIKGFLIGSASLDFQKLQKIVSLA